MGRLSSVLVVAASVTQVMSLCSHNTFLHPRAEGETVEVKTFGYTGAIGPLFWSFLEDGRVNERCSSGTRQSPIDMTANVFTEIPASEIDIQVPDFTEGTEFENLGTTVEVIAKPGGTMTIEGNKTFELQQCHFHLPSEHLDDGTIRAMEMHCVWQSAEQEIAVIGTYIDVATGEAAAPAAAPAATVPAEVNGVGVVEVEVPAAKRSFRFRRDVVDRRQEAEAPPAIVESGAASVFLETVFSKVGDIATPGTVTETEPLILSEIVDLWKAGSFQAYSGSLTTPPCSEGVNWFVSTQTLRIQATTFEKVRSVIGFNSRGPQNAPGQINLQTESLARMLSDLSQAAVVTVGK